MKILIKQAVDGYDNLSEEMYINGDFAESAYPIHEEFDNATLERDITSCSRMAELMQLAFNAGKNGEKFTIKFKFEEYL